MVVDAVHVSLFLTLVFYVLCVGLLMSVSVIWARRFRYLEMKVTVGNVQLLYQSPPLALFIYTPIQIHPSQGVVS